MNNKFWVYKITSPSEKIYIGITSNVIKRFCSYKNNNDEKQTILYNSIKKYGWDAHKKEILYISLFKEEAEQKEIELIKYYKDNKTSLNIADGGFSPSTSKYINTKAKVVLQFDIDGNFIKEWSSINLIDISLSFSGSNIAQVCRKKTFFQHGYLWVFKNDFENGVIPFYTDRVHNERGKKLLLLNSEKIIIREYHSIKDALANYPIKNVKRNIYKSLTFKTADKNGNYWEYKKK